MAARIVFVAKRRSDVPDQVLRRRVAELVGFYSPVQATRATTSVAFGDHFAVGTIGVPAALDPAEDVVWWLERPSRALDTRAKLAAASQGTLRREMRTGLLAALPSPDRARLVTAPCGPTSLYVAGPDEAPVWSTHAVAAAYLAWGSAGIDASRLPELVALGFVGGDGSLVAGVSAVPAATCIDLSASDLQVADYWPLRERWAPVAPEHAPAHAEDRFLESLDARVAGETGSWLGLTAGLDSRVVASAMAVLGRPARTFTWSWAPEDVDGAIGIARRLGFEHTVVEASPLEDEEGLARMRAEVRWSEGLARMSALAAEVWPAGMGCFLTGGAGEVGRAFYWRLLARNFRSPSVDQLARIFDPTAGLALTDAAADHALKRRVRAWLEHAATTEHTGWHLLDVVYAEQRLRGWGRGMVGRHLGATTPAFADMRLLQGLASLRVEDKLQDAFHRRFLSRHAPELSPPEPGAGQRSGVPPAVRRIASRLRSRGPQADPPWPWIGEVRSRPGYDEFLQDVFGHPVVVAGFGEEWASGHARRLRGDVPSTTGDAAVALSGPVALADVLRSLPDATA